MPAPTGPVTLIGHPFAPIGMGEHMRATFRALRAAQIETRVLDVYGQIRPDADLAAEFADVLTDRVGPGPAIHCFNGDEVADVLALLGDRAGGQPRIIYPAWELPTYPAPWAAQLERFDIAWGQSHATHASLAAALRIPVHHVPLPVGFRDPAPLGRRHFGIPESAFVFLFFFDFTSFIQRKNPQAALRAFAKLVEARPHDDLRFVIKLNSSRSKPEQRDAFVEELKPLGSRVVLIDRHMPDAEVKALHRCADAFVSLHRAEGFGFGMAESMLAGRPVIATRHSGNLDFMTDNTALLVDCTLVPVPAGAYPFGEGQVWAEPDVDQAARLMAGLVDDPAAARALGARASRHIRTHFSFRARGLRMAECLARAG
jgi:glycosyltransferase involved in cell wall biosynthesis